MIGLMANAARHEPDAVAALRAGGDDRMNRLLRLPMPEAYLPSRVEVLRDRLSTRPQPPKKAKPAPRPAKAAKPVKAERTVSKKVRNAGARAQLTALAGNQSIRFDKAQQRSAVAAAKARRLAVEGLDTRRSGHAAARVRMKQARRDQRGR